MINMKKTSVMSEHRISNYSLETFFWDTSTFIKIDL